MWVRPGLETTDRNNYISSGLSIPGLSLISRFQNILQTMLENEAVRQTVKLLVILLVSRLTTKTIWERRGDLLAIGIAHLIIWITRQDSGKG